jgi:two-component system response regulator HydG
MSKIRVLLVHPEASVRALLTSMLQTLGCQIEEASSDRVAVRKLDPAPVDLVLATCEPADPEALELLAYLHRKHPRVPCVLLFAAPHPDRMREALDEGAAAVLRYPLPAAALRLAVAQTLGLTRPAPSEAPRPTATPHAAHAIAAAPAAARAPAHALTGGPAAATPPEFADVVGHDPKLRQTLELAAAIAPSRAPVLLVGEPGAGKKLLARALHRAGARADGPFVELECRGLGEAALEVELFGEVLSGGRFRPGRISQARGGTLYLDEVTALSPALQAKLVRAIRDGEYEPVDSDRPRDADVRFVLATREDLVALVERDQFRADLYYRISVLALNVPPLRHRGEDVVRLAEHFRARFARELGRDVPGFVPEALEMLRHHDWPGNVRELENAVEWAVVHCHGARIEPRHFALNWRRPERPVPRPGRATARPPAAEILPLKEALEGPERRLILEALKALNWNRQETARALNINRTTLHKKMKKYGLLLDEPTCAH